jgi:hypothetical protein
MRGYPVRVYRIRPYESLYHYTNRHAIRRKHDFLLTYEEFVAFTTVTECHYCGDSITWAKHDIHKNGSYCNLDRLDDKEYSVANCVVLQHM